MRPDDHKPKVPRSGARKAAGGVLALVLALLCVLFALGGSAPAQSSLNQLQSKMDELSRLHAAEGPLRTSVDSQNAQINALIGRESALRVQEAGVQRQLNAEQTKLNQATAELDAQRTKLRETRARLTRALDQLRNLLVEIYKNGSPDALSVVLSSASWSDVLTQGDYLGRIQSYDDTMAARVKQLRDEIAAAVVQLRGARDRIRTSRNQVATERNKLATARRQVTAQHDQLVAARQKRQSDLSALLARERTLTKDIIPSAVPPGGGATLVNGDAVPPPNAPLQVKAAIEAANQIDKMPYVWGGGHGSFTASGYDCSGAVSYALHGGGLLSSPLDSTGFESWGLPGGGSWITTYANSGHMYAVIAGLRWDTAGTGSNGPRWSTTVTDPVGSPAAFIARHPPGL